MSRSVKLKTRSLSAAVAAALGGAIAVNTLLVAPALAKDKGNPGEWMPGDFHQHTYYTDGSYTFWEVTQSNEDFGLDWWANSEHGGERNRDGNGENWDDPTVYPVNPILGDYEESGGHQEMWRWQSLRDYAYPDIEAARTMMPNKTIISGLEWNVPGHEHCSTSIYQYDDAATLISEFEYRYDGSDDDTSRNGQGSLLAGYAGLAKTNETAEDAVEAVKFMQALKDQGLGDAWVVPAHIERANRYTIADFRNWNNAGPDVAIGYEGAPGHQTSGSRGFGTGADGGGTWGGSGYYSAKVGGLWDALLGEGRNWWNFASSDFHNHWSTGGSDFWPGEYQKTYTYIDTSSPDPIQAVFDGVRSGASWHVMGDLIDKLEFTAYSRGKKAIMGETLEVQKGAWVLLKIKVRDPLGTNHCPLDMNNPSLAQIGVQQPLNRPELDHIDLIGGKVTGYIDPPADFDGCPDVDTRDLATDIPYCKETNDSTAVVKTFERSDRPWFGYMTYFHWLKADEDMYFRLRGTNLPANVPFETDAQGNPLADSEAEANLYSMEGEDLAGNLIGNIEDYVLNRKLGNATTSKLDEVAEAYADLWFYSNPIFIDVK